MDIYISESIVDTIPSMVRSSGLLPMFTDGQLLAMYKSGNLRHDSIAYDYRVTHAASRVIDKTVRSMITTFVFLSEDGTNGSA